MDPIIYFFGASGLLIFLASAVAFLLGLWLGWLIWSKFRRLYLDLRGDAESSLQEATYFREKNIQLEDAHRTLLSGAGRMDLDLTQALEHIARLQETLSQERRGHLETVERLRAEHREQRGRIQSDFDDFRETVGRDLAASRAEAARLGGELEGLQVEHAHSVAESRSTLERVKAESQAAIERLTRESAEAVNSAQAAARQAILEMQAIKSSEIHSQTAASESLRAARFELEKCRRERDACYQALKGQSN